MVKQTKLGFDKLPGQELEQDQPMIDIRGNLLRDQKGDLLYNKEKNVPTSFNSPRNATPAVINNDATALLQNYFGSLPIKEQFPEVSEVSTSLLGIPRGNQQQALLADVSVYGLDENTWEFSADYILDRTQWRTMHNRIHGPRGIPELKEYPNQYALAIEAFPTNFLFPYGPAFASIGQYSPGQFERYLRFVELGNLLYDYFIGLNEPTFAEYNLLPKTSVYVDGEITLENRANADVIYDINNTFETFRYLEGWVQAWMNIRDLRFFNPVDGSIINPSWINNFITSNDLDYTFDDTQPGYNSNVVYYAQLQSKEAFRYQPGAISGFTFGVKMNTDPTSTAITLEWGAVNPTDHYVFQLSGSRFNIVRRSVVPLSTRSLELIGLTTDDQILKDSPNPFETADSPAINTDTPTGELPKQLYETIIPSTKFNGDPLDGTGKSGYNISFNEVTMYKIEFSWYGAIGAKFYAYIPVGNGEARWVLMHTLVIENLLEFPSLKNPYMYFRYSMRIEDTSSLREPIYLYKYGASMYIDGDDDGTYKFNNYNAKTNRRITSFNSVPLLGLIGKDSIKNSDGIAIRNQKNFYIDRLSINSSTNTRLDILDCECCPGGFGHFYAPGLVNTRISETHEFRINTRSQLEYVEPSKFFTPKDNYKKIIADGIYAAYIVTNDTNKLLNSFESIDIQRRLGNGTFEPGTSNTPLTPQGYSPTDLISVNGNIRSPINYQFFGRITGFDDVVASSTPITKANFTLQFLNDQPKDTITGKHFGEFRIGITPTQPELVLEEGVQKLKFGNEDLIQDDTLFADWVPFYAATTIDGAEVDETDPRPGQTFELDGRLEKLPGENTGFCSAMYFFNDDLEFVGLETTTALNTVEFGNLTGSFLLFLTDPDIIFTGSEIGVWNGIEFVGSGSFSLNDRVIKYTDFDSQQTKFYLELDAALDLATSIKDGIQTIAFKVVKAQANQVRKTKAYSFSNTQFYFYIAMRDGGAINNISINQYDNISSSSFVPTWLIDDLTSIRVVNTVVTEEQFDNDGKFVMAGASSTALTPSNYVEINRLDSVKIDNDITLPLRPCNLKTSIFIGEGQTEIIDTNYLFSLDKFKITPGTYNNKAVYLSAISVDPESSGIININVNGKEQ